MVDDPFNDPQLPGLVRSALEMCDQGLEPCFDMICHDRPDLREAVEASVQISQQLPSLRRTAALQDRFVGRVIAERYRLRTRLGAGAMGVVYLAEDEELRRSVAIKILRSEFLDEAESEHRFTREAEVLASIQHSSVVTIYDRGRTADDDPYIVMELLEGRTLNRLLEEGKRFAGSGTPDTAWIAQQLGAASLDEPSYIRTVVSWAADLASGLGAAHQSGVFHRDVKPSNVFIRRDGHPVLLDFGIAAQVSQATITRGDAALGTPAYMAPEALEPDQKPNEALDIYGLTATLYHMLTMRSPYLGSPTQILTQLATKDPMVARKACPGLPRDLQAVLDCGMARRASSRYVSVSELEADLRAFLDYRPVRARRLSAGRRLWRRFWNSQAFVAGTAVAGLVLLALAGYLGRSAWIETRRAAHLDLWRHLPPNLTIVAPSSRVLSPQAGRKEVEELLNGAADVCVDALPTYLVRAAFRLDHGDLDGAVEDMQRIADSVGSEYSRRLAELYAALPRGSVGVDCSVLGEPEEPLDLYLAAFHAMRDQDTSRASALIRDPRLAEYAPARELGLLFLSRDPQRMFEEAISLEESIGQRTAFTAYMLGLSQLLQKHYEKALELLSEGIELAPHSARLRVNAGKAAERLGRIDEAREHLEYAIKVDPNYWRPYENLTRLLIDAGEPDAAVRVLDSAPEGSDEGYKVTRPMLRGEIDTERAILFYVAGQVEKSVETARIAVAHFEEASELPKYEESARSTMSRALTEGDPGAVSSALAELIEDDPLHWRRLNILLGWMPEEPTLDDSRVLERVIEAISAELAARGQQDSSELRRR